MSQQCKERRVVVTGMGALSPVGKTQDEIWSNLSSGTGGIKRLLDFPIESLQGCNIAGVVPDFDPTEYMEKKQARRMDKYMQFAMAASRVAIEDAGINGNVDKERVGVVVGTGAGGIGTIEIQLRKAFENGYSRMSPFLVPMMLCDSAAGAVSIEFGFKGPNMAVITACATGTNSIGEAMRLIQDNEADVIVAGGAEAPVAPLSIAGFNAARALSTRIDSPETASRPFDKTRDGFVIAEGSGIVILEELEHAKARGAKIYGELMGYGSTSDAVDMVAPCVDGAGAARAMRLALADAGVESVDIQYINTHGTSTPLGDAAETQAVKNVFGEYATSKKLPLSSTKSMTGHMLGAAGSFEVIASLLAMKNGLAPPTINYETPDDACDLNYVPNKAQAIDDFKMFMSNSFGFGGHNASLIFSRYENN